MQALILDKEIFFLQIHVNELTCLDIIFRHLNINPFHSGFYLNKPSFVGVYV
jgi:hypothetical protein